MADKGGTATGCSICEYIKNLTPDRVLWEDEYWLGGALLDVPGWIMVMTKRHVEGIWSLNDAEAARFGPMMRDITGVIKDITGAERVHYAAMGEVALHYHNAILPRLPGQTPVWDSMDMVTRAHDDADAVAARDMERVLAGRLGAFENNIARKTEYS